MNRLLFFFFFKQFFLKKNIKIAYSKTSTFELDFKLVSNDRFWPNLRCLKIPKGQTGLPLLSEILKTATTVIEKSFLGGINSVYKVVGSIIDRTSCTCKASTK